MLDRLKKVVSGQKTLFGLPDKVVAGHDELKINIGSLHSALISSRKQYNKLSDLEFRVFSQFGDDGIIQYLTQNIDIPHKTFIEFGVEDYFESNTRFLLQKDNWSGFVIDGSEQHIGKLRSSPFYWKQDLESQAVFITKENISSLLKPHVDRWGGLGLLHIDLDGNDYWIWEALNLKPVILILEYNSNFGSERAVTVPYNPSFYRTDAHYSNLYWGASLRSLYELSRSRGYRFIGCNNAGNNAYFILEDYMNETVREVSLEEGYVSSKYRESRDEHGRLTYLDASERNDKIKGLSVINTTTQTPEIF
ncbi:hypothetical protein [Daejeonella lutea]|uniref:Uncharacterized protein n=1 Tax=Daejeonella lutea TaxID=572036 RepID=A0A1T5FBS3_9SPHI|nr:hypothetical protein [Daejeonella lutea]SKB93619.1 hypothetical protein SAMN05661099_3576 [Daejeonella lutea]